MEINYTIPDEKVSEFVESFLRIYPKMEEEPYASMSDAEWVKFRIKLWATGIYKRGMTQKWEEENSPTIPKEIIQ